MSIFTPFKKGELIPKEERLEVVKKSGRLSIGIPKEEEFQENRIALTPDAVSVLVANGIEITVEAGAGLKSFFSDNEYAEAGAKISFDKKEVYAQPFILKVEPPSLEEIDLMNPNTYLISAVQLSTQCKEYFTKLGEKKITALGFEYIKDRHNDFSIVRMIGEIAGTSAILIASELLCTTHGGSGILMGGITGVRPTDVVIIGAGTVGENAARAAIGLGATVKIFDNSLTRLRRLQDILGQRLSTSIIDPKELTKALIRCDVAIGCLRGKDRTPTVVTEAMVEKMKPGSVIIDVSIDTGGVFETSEITSHSERTVIKHGVIHYGVTNITSRVARTTSKALSNFFLRYFLDVDNYGGFEQMFVMNKGIREGIYMYKGRVTLRQIANWFELPYQDINLLII